MTESSGADGTHWVPKSSGGRDLWFLLGSSLALYLVALASIIWMEGPQRWWVAGVCFTAGVLLEGLFLRREGRKRELGLFVLGVAALSLGLMGAAANVQWLVTVGMGGFLVSFSLRMLLWIDKETPVSRRWTIYLRAFSFPVLGIGGLTETEWLLWTGAVGLGLSVLLPIAVDIATAVRARLRVKQ